MIPDDELNLLVNTVDLAASRASGGDVAAGYEELLYGLHRAKALRDDGEAWGEALVQQWRGALDRYAARFPVGRA